MVTRIISYVFLAIALYLGYFLFDSVKSVIDQEKYIQRVETNTIEKLRLIRDTEVAYQMVHGNYTSNWDSLVNFLQRGTIYITERKEEIVQKEYGAEEVIVHIDTVGKMPAKEYVFTELNLLTAGDTGVITSINFEEGDIITKNFQLYSLQTKVRLFKVRSPYEGTVTKVYVSEGARVNRGANIADIVRYKYPPEIDITRLPFVPGSNRKFDIFADEINRSGVTIDVFEVKDPNPVNPARRKNNNERALRVGSRTDVTIAGNWE
ncbi:MAG: lipoyl domain-containing protein [Cyclobacteriaceae bacterium]|nr:lipoyl domain-containing protein [Cyclobacteriaceae bacterium]